MLPGLAPGAVIMAFRRNPKAGDVVIARQAGREVVKRIEKIAKERYYLHGDNSLESTDSREFGPVAKSDILGVVMIRFAIAVPPPKTRASYAAHVGLAAAGLMVLMSLMHLFRIDTWVPLLDEASPGKEMAAMLTASFIVIAEVFAVPFLLRMKLSPLMQLKSGLLAVLAPLTWLLITMWGMGFDHSTSQLGEFVATPSSWALLAMNAAWLGLNMWALWLLGYDKLAVTGPKSSKSRS